MRRPALFRGSNDQQTRRGPAPRPSGRSIRIASAVLSSTLSMGTLGGTALALSTATPASAAVPTVLCSTNASIFNTGYDASTGGTLLVGSTDANWQVAGPYYNASPAEPAAAPTGAVYSPAKVYVNGAYYEDPSYTSSQYIGSATGSEADYYFEYTFDLDSSVVPADFSLNMDFYADNQVAQVFISLCITGGGKRVILH